MKRRQFSVATFRKGNYYQVCVEAIARGVLIGRLLTEDSQIPGFHFSLATEIPSGEKLSLFSESVMRSFPPHQNVFNLIDFYRQHPCAEWPPAENWFGDCHDFPGKEPINGLPLGPGDESCPEKNNAGKNLILLNTKKGTWLYNRVALISHNKNKSLGSKVAPATGERIPIKVWEGIERGTAHYEAFYVK